MEEFIGFGFIGLLIFGLILVVKKLYSKKKNAYKDEDEIILDNDMVHYGPFSGSVKNPYRKLILLLTVSSSFLAADIELRTIDNWGIVSWGEQTLLLQKTSHNQDANLYIEMERPFCICADPLITTQAGDTNYNLGDKIEAIMTVDNLRPKKIVFDVQMIFEDGSYLLKPKYYPSFRDSQMIKIKFSHNVELDDLLFNIKGMSNAMKQSEKICFSEHNLSKPKVEDVRI